MANLDLIQLTQIHNIQLNVQNQSPVYYIGIVTSNEGWHAVLM